MDIIDGITFKTNFTETDQSSRPSATTASDELALMLSGGGGGGGKTNINGVIDDFSQGATNDCYFLTRLKNLSRKSWGRDAIKSAITPDGNGGLMSHSEVQKTQKDNLLNIMLLLTR